MPTWKPLVIIWAAVCSLLCGALLAFHDIGLPTPPLDAPALRAALAARRPGNPLPAWQLVHVMYARCPCSMKIVDHLRTTKRPYGVVERVILVGGGEDIVAPVRSAGFAVEIITPAALRDEWQVEAAPLLIVADPNGDVRYAAGYTRSKQGPVVEDIDILESLQGGTIVAALPLLGCAVSRELARAVDPLNLGTLLRRPPPAEGDR